MTYTYAILEITPACFEEIRGKLAAAGYEDQFHEHDGAVVIDMHGIAVKAGPPADERRFPVLYQGPGPKNGPTAVPWAWLARFERQCLYNHSGQTLERMAERGGLSPSEMWAVVHGRDWSGMRAPVTPEAAVAWLNREPWIEREEAP